MKTRIIGAILLTLRGHRTNPTKSDRKENNEYKTTKEVKARNEDAIVSNSNDSPAFGDQCSCGWTRDCCLRCLHLHTTSPSQGDPPVSLLLALSKNFSCRPASLRPICQSFLALHPSSHFLRSVTFRLSERTTFQL